MKKYNPLQIEKKWQDYWFNNGVFTASENSAKEKKYILVEFPFPSGDGLHMGHLRSYTAADVVSRYYRMQGKEVMYPLGWDAFGLPAENYAIKHGQPPAETTASNIKNIKRQTQMLGYSFDWTREVNTTEPEYYKWTQWIFLQFYKAGLAYEATGLINWCSKDKTGLANEEVINGACERCGTKVEKKELRQWYLKITDYSEKLLQGLGELPEWPEAVKQQQANWIGKSEGAEIDFFLNFTYRPEANQNLGPNGEKAHLKVFTTRPDTIFGATFLVVSPEHLWVQLAIDNDHDILENKAEVKAYVEVAKSRTEIDRTAEGKEKTGIELKGVKAINPATNEDIPVFVADYVLANYGTGAIMSVPAHDERDFEFAEKFGIEIRQVVAPRVIDTVNQPREGVEIKDRNMAHVIVMHPFENKFIALKWKKFPWLTLVGGGIEQGEDVLVSAERKIVEETGFKNMTFVKQMPYTLRAEFHASHKNVNHHVSANVLMFKLDDLAQDPAGEEEQGLFEPVWIDFNLINTLSPLAELPHILDWLEKGDRPYTGEGVLVNSGDFNDLLTQEALPKMAAKFGTPKTTYKLRDWVFSRQRYWGEPIPLVHCEKDGIVAVPEDQLPVLLPEVKNYEPTGTGESPLAAIDEWVNTTCPQCGGPAKRETNTMPQWAGSSWYYLRYTDPRDDKQFAAEDKQKYWLPVDIYFGGMEHTTLHLLYSRFWNIFLYDQGLVPVSEPYKKRVPHGIVLAADGSKMSKSKGNVINPDDLVKTHGADTVRMYELFLGPHEDSVAWNDKGIVGVARFLDRVWYWIHNAKEVEKDNEVVQRELNAAIKKVTEDIENYRFNTAVSSLMTFHNAIKDEEVSMAAMQAFLKLLYPLVPHIAEEMNEIISGKAEQTLQFETWPEFDPSLLTQDTAKIAVQVNGKVKETIEMPIDASEEEVKEKALSSEKIQAILVGGKPQKIIFVSNKVINIVK